MEGTVLLFIRFLNGHRAITYWLGVVEFTTCFGVGRGNTWLALRIRMNYLPWRWGEGTGLMSHWVGCHYLFTWPFGLDWLFHLPGQGRIHDFMGPVPWNFVALIFVTGHCFIESLQQWSGALRDAIDSVLGFGGGITYLGVRECDGTVLVRPDITEWASSNTRSVRLLIQHTNLLTLGRDT